MRILFLTQYFPPETGAAQNRISYFAKHLAAAGHTVTVLTGMPSYPEGEIFAGYRGHWILEERWKVFVSCGRGSMRAFPAETRR